MNTGIGSSIFLNHILHVQLYTFAWVCADSTKTLFPIGRWHSFIVLILSNITSFLEDSGNLLSVNQKKIRKILDYKKDILLLAKQYLSEVLIRDSVGNLVSPYVSTKVGTSDLL